MKKNLFGKPQIAKKTKKQVEALIFWLEGRQYPVPRSLPLPKLMWRQGFNKAIDDMIALLKYDGEYKDNTQDIIDFYTSGSGTDIPDEAIQQKSLFIASHES